MMTITEAQRGNVVSRRRTRMSEGQRARAMLAVADAAVFNERLLPVLLHNEIIGWIGGCRYPDTKVFGFEHKKWMDREIDQYGQLCNQSSIDGLIQAFTTPTLPPYSNTFCKTLASSPTGQTWNHLWANQGNPGPGDFAGTALTARPRDNTELGAWQHGYDAGADGKVMLATYVRYNSTSDVGVFLLYDMVLTYDNCSFSSSSQNMTNTLPALRYIDTGQPGLQIMGAITAVTSPEAFQAVTYVDNDGNSSSVPTGSSQYLSPSVAGAPTATTSWPSAFTVDIGGGVQRGILTLPLEAGDLGARSITNFDMVGAAAGELAFILGYPIAYLPVAVSDCLVPLDLVRQSPSLPHIFDGAALTFAVFDGGSTHDSYFAYGQWMQL